MIRHIAIAATLAALLATAACADTTAPGNFCQITSGSNNCT